MIAISEGNRYRTKGDHEIVIVKRLPQHLEDYKLGFRYLDNEGRTFKRDGRWSHDDSDSPFDIVDHICVDLLAGRSYFNRLKQSVFIPSRVSPTFHLYNDGYRFIDDIGRLYKRDGTILKNEFDEQYDLIESIPL